MPRLELQTPWPRSQPFQQNSGFVTGAAVVTGGGDPGSGKMRHEAGVNAAGYSFTSRFLSAPKLWPAHEHHVRRPDWTELFFDLIFAAAISQLSVPLDADFSFSGILRYAFLLALIFFAWFGYTMFSTQYAVDDILQRALTIPRRCFWSQ